MIFFVAATYWVQCGTEQIVEGNFQSNGGIISCQISFLVNMQLLSRLNRFASQKNYKPLNLIKLFYFANLRTKKLGRKGAGDYVLGRRFEKIAKRENVPCWEKKARSS